MRTSPPAAALLLVVLGLVACGGERGVPAAPDPPPLRIQVVDDAGAPVPGAVVRTRPAPGSDVPATAGSWDADTSTLSLPPGSRLEALVALAPGFRLVRRGDVAGDLALRLPPGLLFRVELDAEAPLPAAPLQLVLRLRPAPPEEGGPADVPPELLVEGVERAQDPVEADVRLPRGTFGYAVDHRDAARGLRIPAPGAWDVRWGLFDPEAGAWFSLDEGATVRVLLEDRLEGQAAGVTVGADALAQTLAGLRLRVAELAAGR